MTALKDKVAVVTGASRGIGKGIALALGEAGATVYLTGRTVGDGERTIDTTARLVTENGGQGHAIQCDHFSDEQIGAVFERVKAEAGKIDLLVNNVYKIPTPPAGLWESRPGVRPGNAMAQTSKRTVGGRDVDAIQTSCIDLLFADKVVK